jgi:hypothetical protein
MSDNKAIIIPNQNQAGGSNAQPQGNQAGQNKPAGYDDEFQKQDIVDQEVPENAGDDEDVPEEN